MAYKAIAKTDDLPIKHKGNVHSGKVRSVYWLNQEDSKRLADQYGVESPQLGVMVISDRISAFDYNWRSEKFEGVYGKGAALNAISKHWFNRFEEENLAPNHIIDTPHPLVWLVEKAEPVLVEGIARQYITGSMWRAYAKGERDFCGIQLPEGLQENQRLDELLVTPTTKGILTHIPEVKAKNDAEITKRQIEAHPYKFGFKSLDDVEKYENLTRAGFEIISNDLAEIDEIFCDTKFEFGYIKVHGDLVLAFIDEIGTPDSSRMWDAKKYNKNREVVQNSKELFRRKLLEAVPDSDVLTNKEREAERAELAANFYVPDELIEETGELYAKIAENITGEPVPTIESPRKEIIESLRELDLIR